MLIDESVLVAYFESTQETHDVAVVLLDDFIQTGRNVAVVSPITAMGIFDKPLRNAPQSAIHVHDFLTHWPNLTVASIDLNVAQEAASLRAFHEFTLTDSLIIAAATSGGVAHLISIDDAWEAKLAALESSVEATDLRSYL